jgi:hypothetical protein
MSEGYFSRGFRGRRRQTEGDVTLPPGQHLVDGQLRLFWPRDLAEISPPARLVALPVRW